MSEAQQTRPKVLAAIPCFNTEPFIADVVSNAKKYVDQVVVINDGSHDGTAEAARTAGALVIDHEVNRGAGEATKSCFEAAKTNAADVLVTLDGDRQHNPDEVPLLIAPIIKGEADLVIGSRFLGDHSSMPEYRKFGISVITFLYNLGSKTRVSDAQSCFRAYSRKALNSLSITEKGFGFSVQLLIEAERRGLVITEVPISCIYHSASHTLNPVVHGLSVALSVVRIRLKNSLHSLIRGSNARNQGS
ncbi:glycosyltransferase family 2 protein [Dehalococcoidia bacterium]|nr:glycosyltransferase family 2 protein [Dehalococcoidia bacterium]